jgi:hypothetical protein
MPPIMPAVDGPAVFFRCSEREDDAGVLRISSNSNIRVITPCDKSWGEHQLLEIRIQSEVLNENSCTEEQGPVQEDVTEHSDKNASHRTDMTIHSISLCNIQSISHHRTHARK